MSTIDAIEQTLWLLFRVAVWVYIGRLIFEDIKKKFVWKKWACPNCTFKISSPDRQMIEGVKFGHTCYARLSEDK